MHKLMQDVRFTTRQLRRSPGFAITTILTLALGIGATTAIFSLVNAVLLRPLPFPDSGRLASVEEGYHPPGTSAHAPTQPYSFSYPDYFDFRSRNGSFTGIASFWDGRNAVFTRKGDARHINYAVVSANFLRVLGVNPMLGAGFRDGDEKPGRQVVVLSYGFWQSELGAAPDIVGHSITLDGRSYNVVGVMPRGFTFPLENPGPVLWTTLADDAVGAEPATSQRGVHVLQAIARLKAGVTVEQARTELTVIARRLAAQYPNSNKAFTTVFVKPELEAMVGDTRPALRVLFAAVTLLLLIACANVAGLLLARASHRAPEISVRMALGASRPEIVRQMLVESVLLALCGGALGILFASTIFDVLLRFIPEDLPRIQQISIDSSVLAFVTAVSVMSGLLFGVLPALRSSRGDTSPALREGGRSLAGGRRQHRLHNWLVIAETALGLLLLVGSGLLIRSFVRTINVNPGFETRHVLTANLDLPFNRYPDAKHVRFYNDLFARVAMIPGVRSAAAAWPVPLSGNMPDVDFWIEGHPVAPGEQNSEQISVVTPDYFRTLGIPVLRGRAFTDRDEPKATLVMMINEKFARKYFPGENPVGKRVMPGLSDGVVKQAMRTVIGVVADVKRRGLTAEAVPEYYLPYAQAVIVSPTLIIRTIGDPANVIAPLRAATAALDSEVPVYQAATLESTIGLALSTPRFQAVLLASFAAIALLLSAVGLYAVLSYMVVQRTHEIGLRMAVGAQRGDILNLVLRRGLALAAGGLVTGLLLSVALTQFLHGMLYGVAPSDPLTLFGVSAILLLVSLAASSVPAWRAARLDPGNTLRRQ